MTPQQQEALTILIEECGEVIQACTKIIRFGPNNFHPDVPDELNSDLLTKELGHVAAMMHVLERAGLNVSQKKMEAAACNKLENLKKWSTLPRAWLTTK